MSVIARKLDGRGALHSISKRQFIERIKATD
jgi:hypothetical protein